MQCDGQRQPAGWHADANAFAFDRGSAFLRRIFGLFRIKTIDKMRTRIAIELFTEEGQPGKIVHFINDPEGAIEFLQGVPRARNAEQHAAELDEQRKAIFTQLGMFNQAVKDNFK
jgi:hypothetical protein